VSRAIPKLYEHNGESKTLAEWARAYGIPETTLHARVNRYGYPLDVALTTKRVKRGDFSGTRKRR